MHDYQRPPTLYRYAPLAELELALKEGQFRLVPSGSCLVVSFSSAWDTELFDVMAPAESCLVIHNSEEFGERLHRAVQRVLPSWAGIDGAVAYEGRSPLGAAFTRPHSDAREREWRFAWRPLQAGTPLAPVTVRIGSIEQFAELRARDTWVS